MKVAECIALVDSYESNAYLVETKARWLRECEGKVWTELFLMQPIGFAWGSPYEFLQEELSIPAPYNKVYPDYLQAKIHYANGEYDRYANSMQMFNQDWHELVVWFGQDYDSSDRHRNRMVQGEIPLSFDTEEEPPGSLSYALLTIPERCALVGGQLVCKAPDYNGTTLKATIMTEYGRIWEKTVKIGKTYFIPMVIAPQDSVTLAATMDLTTISVEYDPTVFSDAGVKILFSGRLMVPEEVQLDWRKVQVQPVQVEEEE